MLALALGFMSGESRPSAPRISSSSSGHRVRACATCTFAPYPPSNTHPCCSGSPAVHQRQGASKKIEVVQTYGRARDPPRRRLPTHKYPSSRVSPSGPARLAETLEANCPSTPWYPPPRISRPHADIHSGWPRSFDRGVPGEGGLGS